MDKLEKTARLEVRVTEEYKKNVETAAYLRGQNMTKYVLDVLAEASSTAARKSEVRSQKYLTVKL